MNEALLISNALLWVLFLSVLAFCIMLTRDVGRLHDRASADALTMDDGPKVGDKAPALLIPSLTGIPIQLGAPYGQASEMATLLVFVSPTCSACKKLIPHVKRLAERKRDWLRVVFASDGERLAHQEFITLAGLQEFPYILSDELSIAYGVSKHPYAVLIGENGTLQAKGLINSREQFARLFAARELQVASTRWWGPSSHKHLS